MSLVNKSGDMTPFDMKKSPRRQLPLLLPVIWGASFLMTRRFGLRIEKIGMEKIRPPYLVIAAHQGFSDYYIGPLSMFPHRAMYVSDMEGFAAFGKGLYRAVGCIGKRRYVPEISVMKHIKSSLGAGQSVFVYPESRHSNIGITAYIPDNMGKLAKHLEVPLVILSVHGSYLANPFWNEEKTRKVPIKAKMECIYTKEQLAAADVGEVQKSIEEALAYDEYDYQHREGFLIKDADRAEGLEKALYRCRNCGKKYEMKTHGSALECISCGKHWELSEDGWLISGGEKVHLPDWYREEIAETENMLSESAYEKSFGVRTEALPNEKGFVLLGEGTLLANEKEFVLSYGDNELHFPHRLRESVQTEYNYRGKGKCIVLSTADCCYYIYSDDSSFEPTELQFIGEYFYKKSKRKINVND